MLFVSKPYVASITPSLFTETSVKIASPSSVEDLKGIFIKV